MFIPNPLLWKAINCMSCIKCPVGALPITGGLLENNPPLVFASASAKDLLLPSTSSNHGRGPSGENLKPRIISTPGVSWAASASAWLGIAGAFGCV